MKEGCRQICFFANIFDIRTINTCGGGEVGNRKKEVNQFVRLRLARVTTKKEVGGWETFAFYKWVSVFHWVHMQFLHSCYKYTLFSLSVLRFLKLSQCDAWEGMEMQMQLQCAVWCLQWLNFNDPTMPKIKFCQLFSHPIEIESNFKKVTIYGCVGRWPNKQRSQWAH